VKRLLAGLALAAQASFAMVIDPVDPAFGVAVVETPIAATGARTHLVGLAPTSGGRVAVLAAQQATPGCLVMTLVMFRADGTIDVSFGDNGRLSSAMLGLPAGVGAGVLAAGTDGALYFLPGDAAPGLRVRKLLADGRADVTFGSNGTGTVPGINAMSWLRASPAMACPIRPGAAMAWPLRCRPTGRSSPSRAAAWR
jgi:hypothetical protein